MRSINWFIIFVLAALLGIGAGYAITLIYKPSLIPPSLRLGGLREPATILLLGTDVVYTDLGYRNKKIDQEAFNGRSDTIIVANLDPYRNALSVISIPRDTEVSIPHYGTQKINSANAFGGPQLAMQTVSDFLQLPIDHYVVLNVHGLVELVNELGGITVEIPKRMKYMDWTAKLKIDLTPGFHTLTGNQAMGFVRFRHDALGDIGRVQRQEIFLRAVLDKACQPSSWTHIPRLIEIAQKYILTDMNVGDMMNVVAFVRSVPKQNQFLAMMPGTFSSNGDWLVEPSCVRKMVAHMKGSAFLNAERRQIKVTVENASANPQLAYQVSKMLRSLGYNTFIKANEDVTLHAKTKIIAEKGNPEDADLVKSDLFNQGEIINASVGDIESAVTIIAGNDLDRALTN